MTDGENEKLEEVIGKLGKISEKLDVLLTRPFVLTVPAFPTDKLDEIIQILKRLEAAAQAEK